MTDSITVTLPRDLAEALADHPALLRPDDPGLVWVTKVKAAVAILQRALEASVTPSATPPATELREVQYLIFAEDDARLRRFAADNRIGDSAMAIRRLLDRSGS